MCNSCKQLVFLLLLFYGCCLSAQDYNTKIEGRVYSKDGDVAATHVSNVTQNRGAITDVSGYFEISVKLNDTLVFSAVQYKKKEIVVTVKILKSKQLEVPLEEALTQLNEVVVTPYNLTGDLNRDAKRLKIKPIVTASTLGLPNAYVKKKTQNERRLAEADGGKFIEFGHYALDSTFNPMVMINIHKILNRVTGRTKTLKKYVTIDKEIILLNKVKKFYHDSIYEHELKIPSDNINDFMNFCEVDSMYTDVVASDDILRLWEFLERNSVIYRENNDLD
ncbi:MAG: carboxypeptidase-like regulatory domain-containing protein [Maribacter sp.]